MVAPPPAAASAPAGDDGFTALTARDRSSRLDAVAAAAAHTASLDYVVSAAALQAAMATAVGSGVWPHVLTGWGTDAQIAAQLAAGLSELRDATAIAELGFATAGGPAGRVGVIVAVPPPTLPLVVERDGGAARLRIAWPWPESAAAFAITPTTARRLAARPVAGVLELVIDCAAPAAIEIRAGARVIAAVVDACAPVLAVGEPPPAIGSGPPATTSVEIEMRVWALVNRERVAHGLPALAWDDAGHQFAREHAADMARYAYVGHETPGGASYAERVAAAPFATRFTHENVGHAWGPSEVHDAFMHSLGHRANLLAGEVDRGAVGVAVDPGDPQAFYVTEFFRR
jgi:uncharacterized protein YkwD